MGWAIHNSDLIQKTLSFYEFQIDWCDCEVSDDIRSFVCGVATGKLSCYVCRLVLAVFAAVLAATSATLSKDFVVYNTLEDGELETRIQWKHFVAKEVTVGRGLGITFRQLTDGKHFIQLIYDEREEISDCEYVHQKQSVSDFIDTFRKDVDLLTTLYNTTIVELNGKLPDLMKHWMNYKKLRDQCKKKHFELKKMLRTKARSDPEDAVTSRGSHHHKQQPRHRKYHHSHRNNSLQNHSHESHSHSHSYENNSHEDNSHQNNSHENNSHENNSHESNLHGNNSHMNNSHENNSHGNNSHSLHNHRHQNRNKRATSFDIDKSDNYLLFPGTLWCGRSDAADRYTSLGIMTGTDKCCRRHDYCKNNIPGFSYRHGMFNNRPFTLSECKCDMSGPRRGVNHNLNLNVSVSISRNASAEDLVSAWSRHRRDLGDYLRVPGTKWCGKGRSAYKYTDVGMFSTTDKCCRRHDSACRFWILGFDTKYGLFNWRVNTIMHCHCDERFRACLKRVGTSDANLVGKLFFNVVQTKCFVFKPKKSCVQRSWWGKCQKKKFMKQAVLRDNMPY